MFVNREQGSVGRLTELGLFLQALRLARLAQWVSAQPVDLVARRMLGLPLLPCRLSLPSAALAAGRASRWWSRLTTGLDSCLIRTLVTGVLLADRPGVVLHVGFRPSGGTGAPHDGHAWLTVDGRELPQGSTAPEPGEPFTEVRAIQLERAGEEG